MDLQLNDDDAKTLRGLLRDHLPDLKREVARTDAKAFRHALALRWDVVERLLEQLDREVRAA